MASSFDGHVVKKQRTSDGARTVSLYSSSSLFVSNARNVLRKRNDLKFSICLKSIGVICFRDKYSVENGRSTK